MVCHVREPGRLFRIEEDGCYPYGPVSRIFVCVVVDNEDLADLAELEKGTGIHRCWPQEERWSFPEDEYLD